MLEHTFAVQEHLIAGQSLLEGRAHEVVTRTRLVENPEVNIEEWEINNKRNGNKARNTGHEMLPEVVLKLTIENLFQWAQTAQLAHHCVAFFLNVEDVPKVNDNSDSNACNGQNAVNFRSPSAGHKCSCQN